MVAGYSSVAAESSSVRARYSRGWSNVWYVSKVRLGGLAFEVSLIYFGQS